MKPTLISLFDFTGQWSQPFRDAGWRVIQADIKHGQNVFTWEGYKKGPELEQVHGILSASPCTAYAGSGARWFAQKDADGTTEYFDRLTRKGLEVIWYWRKRGLGFWALENPVGRIASRVPELAPFKSLLFDPWEFGDPYTKKTVLYGEFNTNLPKSPVYPSEGSKMHKLGPSPERNALRSETPPGFSKAFFDANRALISRITLQPTLFP